MKAIEIKNLEFGYEDNIIFKDLNIDFYYNQIYLITSKTGLGKSTLLGLINGKIQNYDFLEYKGDILVNGVNIKDKDIPFISKYVSSVFQNPDLQIIENTVEDEIAFGLESNNINSYEIYEKIEEITNLLELDKKQNPNYLSGGQKQKLIIASNIVLMKKILILDEPLSHLDIKSSKHLMNILKELKEKYKLCVIIFEHKIEQIYKDVDFLYKIKDKNLVEFEKKDVNNEIECFKKYQVKENNNLYSDENILISLKSLNYKKDRKIILKDINLDIFKGEKLLIIGDNGEGKTTLLEILSKLKKVSKKQYVFKKLKELKKKKKWFDIFGQIFQNPNYQLFNKTVYEEIYFERKENEYINNLINILNLKELLKKHPFSLSEGEKRRLAICSILAKEPDICLLDEPSVGQDIKNLKNLYNLIDKINKEKNTTFIIVSHDINFLSYDFDRIIWIKDNTIYKVGNKELIYSYLKGEDYVR